jgi:hypothetical protein
MRPDLSPEIADTQALEAPAAAREQFIHGLLDSLHADGEQITERRIAAVLASLGARAGAGSPGAS